MRKSNGCRTPTELVWNGSTVPVSSAAPRRVARALLLGVSALLSLEVPFDGADAVEAQVLYAGGVAGSVTRLVQINIRVPMAARSRAQCAGLRPNRFRRCTSGRHRGAALGSKVYGNSATHMFCVIPTRGKATYRPSGDGDPNKMW